MPEPLPGGALDPECPVEDREEDAPVGAREQVRQRPVCQRCYTTRDVGEPASDRVRGRQGAREPRLATGAASGEHRSRDVDQELDH
jgi:hypothetical protein